MPCLLVLEFHEAPPLMTPLPWRQPESIPGPCNQEGLDLPHASPLELYPPASGPSFFP